MEYIKILRNPITDIDEKLRRFASEVADALFKESKIEAIITYPEGYEEIDWYRDLSPFYHKDKDGGDIHFTALYARRGAHYECCSGFDEDEPVLIILFKNETDVYNLNLGLSPDYFLFGDDKDCENAYPCGVVYYFDKDAKYRLK